MYDEPIIIPAGTFYYSNVVGWKGRTYTRYFLQELDRYHKLGLCQMLGPFIYDSVRVYFDGVLWGKSYYL